jgi:hypothetical protein
MRDLDEDARHAEYDRSARLENDEGVVTTFYRIMMKRRGGGDVEKERVVMEDGDGDGIHAYRVEDSVYYPVHPEWIAEARDSDTPFAEIRQKHLAESEQRRGSF